MLAELEHGAPPVSIDFDDSGSWLVTQDAAHALRVWKPADNGASIITRQASSFWNTAFSAGFLLLGSLDQGYEVVRLPEAIPLGPVLHHGVPTRREAPTGFAGWTRFAAGEGIALTYDGSRAVRFWQVSTAVDAEPVGDGRPTQIHAAALDRTGRQVALATGAGDVRILPMGEQPLLLPGAPGEPAFIGHLAPVTAVRFDRTGDAVASGSLDGSVRIWEAATGAPRPFFSSHVDGAVHDLVFSPDGQQLASASRGIVMVIDTQSGALLAQTAIQSSQPQLAVGPQGDVIYVAGDRGGLTRWVWRGGVIENMLTLDAGVTRVALSPDGRFLVVADGARRIRLIDAGFGESLGSPRLVPAAVDRLWFSAKGDRVIAQAGLWVHTFSTAAGELDYLATRRLSRSPVALQPLGDRASVLTITGVSRPSLSKINLLSPLTADMQQLSPPSMSDLEAMIGLTLTDWGEPRTLN